MTDWNSPDELLRDAGLFTLFYVQKFVAQISLHRHFSKDDTCPLGCIFVRVKQLQ